MSTRQMAYAAHHGRRLTFVFEDLPEEVSLRGYLVGMDDYHWLVAEPMGEDIETHLVHKGSVRRVRIEKKAPLSEESPAVKAAVLSIGGAFFDFCEDFLGRRSKRRSSND